MKIRKSSANIINETSIEKMVKVKTMKETRNSDLNHMKYKTAFRGEMSSSNLSNKKSRLQVIGQKYKRKQSILNSMNSSKAQ